MRSASPALTALLLTRDFVKADIYTITLSGGVVVRWTDADTPLVWGGNTFARGPRLKRSSVSDKMGLETSTLTVKITPGEADTINSVPLLRFIAARGLDGANVKLEVAFMPDWSSAVTGVVNRFSGRITSVGDVGGAGATVTVSSWTILLNAMVPPNVYQSGCMRVVYDAGCGLSEAALAATGTVSASSSPSSFRVSVSGGPGGFAQGRIRFTSGPNAGLSRTVKSADGSGNLVLLSPLPVTPTVGDSVIVSPGCDLTRGTCLTKFNNLGRHKATPFVPIPETAV